MKYLVVTNNEGVVKVSPVANTVPAVDESANQLNVVPDGAVALKPTVPAPQRDALTATVTAVGSALNVATTAVRAEDEQSVVVFLDAAYNVIEAVVRLVSIVADPLLSNVPPVAALYQSIVSPAPAVAPKVTDPAAQLESPIPAGAIGRAIICANTAVLAEKQPAADLEAT